MITPGQTLENPVTGERFTFTHTADSSNGELLAFDFALRPGGAVPIPHVHPIRPSASVLLRLRASGLLDELPKPAPMLPAAKRGPHTNAHSPPNGR
jgi:hypothetical protein